MTKYDFIKLPTKDIWGVLMRKDSSLAEFESITPKDLRGKPVICSNQMLVKNELAGWLGGNERSLNIVTTYNLLYNASLLVEEKQSLCTVFGRYHPYRREQRFALPPAGATP